jgi:predicted ATPase/class 3 adenylate cyclase
MVVVQPTGTVTMLFSDIEGSTRLLERLGTDSYSKALDLHRRLLREAFERHQGYEVDYEGDAFFVAFASAEKAVGAAAEAQRAVADADWPEGGEIRVRMGLHTGEPVAAPPKYVGLDVHRAARIMDAAHGGQVILSRATHVALEHPPAVRDLGEHRLKDFDTPVWIYQLGEDEFPPLRTISNTNLPRPSGAFVGRVAEVDELVGLLSGDARLVTLSGPGGSGKTRVAIEAAGELLTAFRAGVFWVALADLRDPALVTTTIGRTLGAREELASHIGDREMLLLLDNFEHVVEAAPELAKLLEQCEGLRFLVTSREVLRLAGEVELPVEPLASGDAVELFCRLARCKPSEDVRALCEALDNLPLGIELAAARARVLSPAEMLARASDRLDLFVGGRDARPQQRTLRATIEWSYEMLTPAERRLFTDLGVFEGGWTIEAAEQAASAELDLLQELAEKSLIRLTDGRFWMLETIRAFAVEQLERSGRAGELSVRHATYFARIADEVSGFLDATGSAEALASLDAELPNFRAAIRRVPAGEEGRELALELAGSLTPFWAARGYLAEGRSLLETALTGSTRSSVARAKALRGLALLASLQGEWESAERWSRECLELAAELGEPKIEAPALATLGRALLGRGEPEQAREAFSTSLALSDATGLGRNGGIARFNLGWASLTTGDLDLARRELDDSLARFTMDHWDYGITRSLSALAAVALHAQSGEEALRFLRQSLALSHRLRDLEDGVWALELYGVALASSNPQEAAGVLGAAEAGRAQLGISDEAIDAELHHAALDALQNSLGEQSLRDAWGKGRRLGVERALERAVSPVEGR